VLGSSAEFIIPQTSVRLGPLADFQLPIFVVVPRTDYTVPADFHFTVTDSASGEARSVGVRFRGP
jgi:hypothetical protein